MAKQPLGDVVVLLPGILGSVLQRDGKDVWAPTPGAVARGLWTLGRSVKSLQLTSDPWEVDDLGDGVTAPRLMSGVHLVPGLWSIDVYAGISAMITETFDVVPGETYIEFPYDWRRDNRVAARRLQRLAEEKLHAQRQRNPDAKLILIGHSMGGLVARYFLECLGGRADTRMLITFGTPHRGSLNAVDFLVNGFVKKLGPLKVADLSTLLRSLTSVYQLLPIYPCVDVGNGHERVAEVDLPHVDRSRAAAALHDFHRAIEAGAAAHEVGEYAIHSVVGITQGTKQSGRLDGERLVHRRALRRRRHGWRRHRPARVVDAHRDRRPAAGVPADVLVRGARRAAARRGGADPAARHPHGPPAAVVPRRARGARRSRRHPGDR